MWYLGSWFPPPESWFAAYTKVKQNDSLQRVVSAVTYKEGLVWKAIGAHPPGAKPPGFGSWSKPPAGAHPLPSSTPGKAKP